MTGRANPADLPGDHASVTAAEIIRNFGHWQHRALEAPLTITHHGRARVMLIAVETYERLVANKLKNVSHDPIELLQFIDNTSEGFLSHDEDLRVTYVNKVAEDYFGKHRAQIVGTVAETPEWDPGDDYVRSMWLQVLKTGESVSYETESLLFPGRRISVRAFPFKNGVATLFVNITERERLRAKAETSKALLAAIEQDGSVATAMLDLRGRMLCADAAFPLLLGFTADDLRLVRLTNCILPKDRKRAEQFFEEVRAQGKSGVIGLEIIVKSGEARSFKIAAVPMMRDYVLTGVMLMIGRAPDDSTPAH